MILRKRKHGSQRMSKPIKLTFLSYNTAGQGGVPYMTLVSEDQQYYMFEPENEAEARVLLSEAHIVFANMKD